ncbi:MAG TPA: Zn-ribbon domain-containing OB-fold protein [Halioglobus sp.]
MSGTHRDDLIPLPHTTALSRPHWDACREGKLKVQRCRQCETYIFIPQPRCTTCQSADLEWVECSGRGLVYSFTVVHRAPRPQFEIPYIVAIIAMEEGWHMLSNVLECAPEDAAIGLAVKVRFKKMNTEITLPYFVRA